MKDLTRFINDELKPRFYDHVQQIFPELHFKPGIKQYCSEIHFDGATGSGKKFDRCVITRRCPTKIYDNTRQKSKDVIDAFMELNGITKIGEAVEKLCAIVGILPPERSPEAMERYIQAEKRRTALEASLDRQKKALFTEEGAEVFNYLLARGWTKDEIKEAELGFISPIEAYSINAQEGIGDFYTLSIPLRSGSVLYGFKFRTIQKNLNDRDKYTYLRGTERRGNLFGLTGVQEKEGSIVVVEGELDALHAQVRGLEGVVATGGGKLTEELLTAATERGIKRITLLFDADEHGAQFVRESIGIAHGKGISVLVATFPEGENLPDGTPVHDIDEYLQLHSVEELQGLIDGAEHGGTYLLTDLISNFAAKHENAVLEDRLEIDLRNEVISLANHTPNDVERELILNTYASFVNIDGKQAFSKEALAAVADADRAKEDKIRQKEATENALRESMDLCKKGDVQEALRKMADAAKELSRLEHRQKYSKLLTLPTEEGLGQIFQNRKGSIFTKYELKRENGQDRENFTLPPRAITLICAPTSHGKSTFLQNLALQVAEEPGDGTILYFSFEECAEDVTLQFLNKSVDMELCRTSNSRRNNNIRALQHYYREPKDSTHFFSQGVNLALFEEKKKEFFEKYYASGKIRIFYEDFDSDELIEAIHYIHSQTRVKCVFVDYMQLLISAELQRKRIQRPEELKRIAKSLNDTAIELDIPMVVGAQLNREATSPLEMHAQRIADAADLERIANKIICLWNTDFQAQKSKNSSDFLIKKLEDRLALTLGKGGKIYAKLVKNRSGNVGLEAVFDYHQATGLILPNISNETDSPGHPENDTQSKLGVGSLF